MAQEPVYADITELYDRFAAADIVRLADDTGTLDTTETGPDQVKAAYDGSGVQGFDDAKEAATEAAETVKDALRDAEAEINGYLQSSYDVPVATSPGDTPRIVRRIACDIAHYRLQDHPTDPAQDRYDKAVSDLEKIARGTIELGLQADGDEAPAGGSRASADQGPTTFGRTDLDSWRQGGNQFPAS